MNDQELHTAANTLAAEISNEITALAHRRAAPLTESQQAVAIRATALAAERERRDRAGVRVRASADDLSERMLAHSTEVLALTAGVMTRNSADVVTLTALLGRAVAMITQMGDALTAPERVAAEAERAADAAALAADRAHDERIVRVTRENAEAMADLRARGLAQ